MYNQINEIGLIMLKVNIYDGCVIRMWVRILAETINI